MHLLALMILAVLTAAAQTGEQEYTSRCAACHGADGNGGERGPAIVTRLIARTDAQLADLIRRGLPGAGMPGYDLPPDRMATLIEYVRSLRPRRFRPPEHARITTTEGRELQGVVLNRSAQELQLRTDDQRIHLLRVAGDRYRSVTSQMDWTTYHGSATGNRYSSASQINRTNVRLLGPRWIFTLSNASRLEVTPVVVEGIMYVTAANEAYALDAGSGRQLWNYRRPRTKGVIGDAGGGINRGVAVAGHRLFMVTDHAHLIALDRFTGALLWDTEMADYRQNYGATAAPLTVGGLVISGISGGDEGVRGFLSAFDQETGKEVWRFWTVPKPGEPGSETWKGSAIEHGCAATWLTGTYDENLQTLYWPTGNPCPDYNGDERKGDNLYSDSILALDVKTGKLKWHYQYTPHDLWDWDAQQPPVLVDANWNGRMRGLLLHANRNGFFYVLDRRNGELLRAVPFVKKLTWAKGIGPDHRPILNPGQEPSAEGTRVCPAVEGATNWFSTSFSPETGLYYVQSLEKCNIFIKTPGKWEAGKSYYNGSTRQVPNDPGQKILRAIDFQTGEIAWELPQVGPANSWGGTLATAGGLVFFGDDSGSFSAADAVTGRPLWTFPTHQVWKASPMTYVFDDKQFVAVASGPNIIAFGLPD
jgi:alcohol dehydrogenase (cytochrome c)